MIIYGNSKNNNANRGFTLLEIMLAVMILAVVSTVTYMTFSTLVKAWSRGSQLTDELNHGDFVIEQMVDALRSAYYPESLQKDSKYGFWQKDNGDGENAEDEISWVTIGSSLIGRENVYYGSPHRVRLTIEDDEDGDSAIAVRSWRVKGQEKDFDPDDIKPVFLSKEIIGMNCRTAYEMEDGEFDWLDEWEETNKVPRYVEITLYMKPLAEGNDPVEVKRLVHINAGELSWGENLDIGNSRNNNSNTHNRNTRRNNRRNTRNNNTRHNPRTNPGGRMPGSPRGGNGRLQMSPP